MQVAAGRVEYEILEVVALHRGGLQLVELLVELPKLQLLKTAERLCARSGRRKLLPGHAGAICDIRCAWDGRKRADRSQISLRLT